MTYKIITSQDTIEFDLKDYTGVAMYLSGGVENDIGVLVDLFNI